MESLMTTKEAAELFSVRQETILEWIRAGKLPAIRMGNRGRYRISTQAVLKLVNAA